jgi:hypothetical protein
MSQYFLVFLEWISEMETIHESRVAKDEQKKAPTLDI